MNTENENMNTENENNDFDDEQEQAAKPQPAQHHSYRAEYRSGGGYQFRRFAANTDSMEIATRTALQLCGDGEQLIGVVCEGTTMIIDVVDGGAA